MNDKAEEARRLFEQGKSLAEIAQVLDVSPGTVRSWKSRGKWGGNVATQRNVAPDRCNAADTNTKLIQSVEENPELTDQQRAFCLHYIKTFNATASYQRAYGCGYGTAQVEGHRSLTRPHIRAEITRLKAIRSQAILAGPDDIVEKYMHIAFADITDYLEFGRMVVPVMGPFGPVTAKNPANGKKEVITKEVNDVRFKESSEVDGTLISEVKQGKDGASVKLADRMKALEWLAGFFELNPMDKHRVEYEAKKLELDRDRLELDRKAEAAKSQIDEFDPGDDGFMDALNGKAAEAWSDSHAAPDASSEEDEIQDVSTSGGKTGEK